MKYAALREQVANLERALADQGRRLRAAQEELQETKLAADAMRQRYNAVMGIKPVSYVYPGEEITSHLLDREPKDVPLLMQASVELDAVAMLSREGPAYRRFMEERLRADVAAKMDLPDDTLWRVPVWEFRRRRTRGAVLSLALLHVPIKLA